MSSLLISTLLVAAVPDAGRQAPFEAFPTLQARALPDRELAAIRGARGFAFTSGRGGVARLTQDSVVREFTIPGSVAVQQFDSWFADEGATLIAANLIR